MNIAPHCKDKYLAAIYVECKYGINEEANILKAISGSITTASEFRILNMNSALKISPVACSSAVKILSNYVILNDCCK